MQTGTERTIVGTTVATFTATTGATSVDSYTVTGTPSDVVEIATPSSGEVTLTALVDYEANTEFVLLIVATDDTAATGTATVTVPIGDVAGPPFTTTTKELCVADGLGPAYKKETLIHDNYACLTLDKHQVAGSQEFLFEMSPSLVTPLSSFYSAGGRERSVYMSDMRSPAPYRHMDVKQQHLWGTGPPNNHGISQVTAAGSGEYTCVANSDIGGVVTRATLTVLDRPDPPCNPDMKTQVVTSVHLEWPPPSTISCRQIQGYTIEFNEVGLDYWQAGILYAPTTSQVIGDLSPGAIYQFRVRANNTIGMSDPSIPSDFRFVFDANGLLDLSVELTENADGNLTTLKTTYENDFTELDELERGRFSIVKKTSQNSSGQHFSAKYIKKHGTCKALVETEYNTVQYLQHPDIVRVHDLYETPDHYLLIMQTQTYHIQCLGDFSNGCKFENRGLVEELARLPKGRLFEYICTTSHYNELHAADFINELLEAIQYLHNCRIAHLDINLPLDISNSVAMVKLTDFGAARHIYNNYYVHAASGDPEFLAPEIVAGTPIGLLFDI
ncbi:KALRN-like protein, partial [Mya arenaria]